MVGAGYKNDAALCNHGVHKPEAVFEEKVREAPVLAVMRRRIGFDRRPAAGLGPL